MILATTTRRGGAGAKSGESARLRKVQKLVEQYLRRIEKTFDIDRARRGMQMTEVFTQEIPNQHSLVMEQMEAHRGRSLIAGEAATVESGTCNENTKEDENDDITTTGIAIMMMTETEKRTKEAAVSGTTMGQPPRLTK